MSISTHDILTFHRLDRGLYNTLIRLGHTRDAACNILALFMWLEQISINPISYIYNNPNHSVIVQLLAEAESILSCICVDTPKRAGLSIPIISSLVNEPLDLGFFCCNHDAMMRGVAQILDGVGRIIFDDHLNEVFVEYEASVQMVKEKSWKWQTNVIMLPRLPQELAKPYKLHGVMKSEEERSLFVTFYNGTLLSRQEIVEYFAKKWGNCVEKVDMQHAMMMMTTTTPRATPTPTPTYGRIIFTSDSYINLMLNGKSYVKLIINGRLVWVQRFYQPNDATTAPTTTTTIL